MKKKPIVAQNPMFYAIIKAAKNAYLPKSLRDKFTLTIINNQTKLIRK